MKFKTLTSIATTTAAVAASSDTLPGTNGENNNNLRGSDAKMSLPLPEDVNHNQAAPISSANTVVGINQASRDLKEDEGKFRDTEGKHIVTIKSETKMESEKAQKKAKKEAEKKSQQEKKQAAKEKKQLEKAKKKAEKEAEKQIKKAKGG